ncbi:transposase [Sediminibacterium sp.]|uniref:transposase n=1 Tax=Sediminibacterium sp. TaxID=1917865 RepID=UPI003F7054B7
MKLKKCIINDLEKRANALLIIFTPCFKHTTNHRQSISFAGLSSTEYSNETNIKGSNRFYKKGGKPIRDVLYMCAMNAK